MAENKQVVSPLPGVFYRRPSPEEEEFVTEGQKVKPGDVIGIVEVMKSFTEIKSEVEGIISKITVESEEVIDVGQVIAEIE